MEYFKHQTLKWKGQLIFLQVKDISDESKPVMLEPRSDYLYMLLHLYAPRSYICMYHWCFYDILCCCLWLYFTLLFYCGLIFVLCG